MSFLDLFWIYLVISTLLPMVQRRLLNSARRNLIRKIEKANGSRVITLIHRQESVAFLGIPISRYIDIDDSEAILRAIKLTPDDLPIDLVVHTPGGLVLATEQISHALTRHKARVTVYVPHYAMSGGTLLAMAADEIVMDENAVLGPVDPQIGEFPAASIIATVEAKPIAEVDDRTLILADVARKAMTQVHDLVVEILEANGMGDEQAHAVADTVSRGKWTHDYPIFLDEAKALGLPVRGGLPEDVYKLMELYPQQSQRRPSVEYIPMPYRREPTGGDRP